MRKSRKTRQWPLRYWRQPYRQGTSAAPPIVQSSRAAPVNPRSIGCANQTPNLTIHRINPDRHGAVVDQGNLHMGAEASGFDAHAFRPEGIDKFAVKPLRGLKIRAA